MVNKKLLISFLLILLVAVSASAVSAADDADAVAADDSAVLAAQTIVVEGDDDVAINAAIANATTGSTIDLGKDKNYNINGNITVNKQVILTGDNVVFLANGSKMPDGVINVYADGSGTTISGITFNNTDDADNYLYKYNGMIDAKGKSVKTSVGIAIDLWSAANNVVVDNCVFYNWFNNAVSINSANNAIVQNSQFYGGSATFINNIPDGPKDRGTYHISAMSSRGTTVINNTFAGTVCDGVSIAGSSFDSTVTGNTFIDNAFSIYFGGKSTEGTLINDNTFINCGWFESEIYNATGSTGKSIAFYDLPVISVQKSSESFAIVNNTFYARNANVLIKALEGSTAHGGESPIGNITITDNTVLGLDQYYIGGEKVVMPSVNLVYIETYNDLIMPVGEIKIANNKLNGARAASYWTTKWGNPNGDVSIVAATIPTVIAINSLKDSTIKGTLKDIYNKKLGGEEISYTADGVNGTVETAVDGTFVIENVTGDVDLAFAAYGKYAASDACVEVPAPVVQAKTKLAGEGVKVYAGYDGIYYATLTCNGTPLVDKLVKVVINGKNYVNRTDANGTVTIHFQGYKEARVYTVSVYYAGTSTLSSAYRDSKVVVVKNVLTMDAPKYSYKIGDTKKVTVTVKDQNGKAVAGKSLTLSIAGNTYTATTNANGIATFTPTVVTAGTYNYAVRFAGDVGTYAATVKGTMIVSR